MRKTIFALLVGLLLTPAHGAGTVPGFSTTVQFDNSHNVAAGCTLYIIQASTTSTPQIAYQDTNLTIPVSGGSQINCDANGRLPQFFLADGQIKFRLVDKNSAPIFVQDNLLVIGPSSGGGGGPSVDPTTVLATGDFKMQYAAGPITGFVRCNGRSIGSSTSGATERANADTSALFTFLYTADPNLAVSGGRGANAAADFAANKTITLPDCRGRGLAGLDDMGNSAAGRLTATYFGTAATALGAAGGGQSQTLLTANLPPYTPVGALSIVAATRSFTTGGNSDINTLASGNTAGTLSAPNGTPFVNGGIASTFSGQAQGGTSTPVATIGPRILTTIYLKL